MARDILITSAKELSNIPLSFTHISDGKIIVYRNGKFVMEFPNGSDTNNPKFTELEGVPSSYTGSGKLVSINATNNGLEFIDVPEKFTYTSQVLDVDNIIDLTPYKQYNRLVYRVNSTTSQEFSQELPKLSETKANQIILIDNQSNKEVTLIPNSLDKIGSEVSLLVTPNTHLVLTPDISNNCWEVSLFGEKFQGKLVKDDILNSLKGGSNISISREVDGEITINSKSIPTNEEIEEMIRKMVANLDEVSKVIDEGDKQVQRVTEETNLGVEVINDKTEQSLISMNDKIEGGLSHLDSKRNEIIDEGDKQINNLKNESELGKSKIIEECIIQENKLSEEGIIQLNMLSDYVKNTLKFILYQVVTDADEDLPLIPDSYYEVVDDRGNKYSVYVDENSEIPENSVIRDVAGCVRIQAIVFPCALSVKRVAMLEPNTEGHVLIEIRSNFEDLGDTDGLKEIVRLD